MAVVAVEVDVDDVTVVAVMLYMSIICLTYIGKLIIHHGTRRPR